MTDRFFQLKKLCFFSMIILLTGCSATFENHGHTPSKVEVEQLLIGKDSKQSVKKMFGPPSSLGLVDDDKWFYLSTKVRYSSYRTPEIVTRKLVAFTFANNGALENVEVFQLDNQEVVVLSRRITDSGIKSIGLIRQILNSAGNYDPTTALE
jgi:outer membrane protein assembly factor BamE (lipoprotein component of BamABCDE complex)